MDGGWRRLRVARPPSFSSPRRSFVRSHRDLGEFAPTQQHAKCAKGKMPDSTAIVTPISIITERALHQPPCYHA